VEWVGTGEVEAGVSGRVDGGDMGLAAAVDTERGDDVDAAPVTALDVEV